MPMYNLLEYNGNYAKTSASLSQYCTDDPDDNITDSKSFKFKSIITDNINNADIANVKIVVPLKYLNNFWKSLEMPLINCEVTLDIKRSGRKYNCKEDIATRFAMTSVKLYVLVVTLSTQDNAELLQQLKSRFKRTINWNK